MSNRRKLVPFFVLLFFGLASFFSIASKPRFETIHAVDVVQLIGIGMCFGAAIATLVLYFRGPRSG
jgi:hypothetical protein